MDVRRSAIRRLESGRGGRAGSRSRQAGGRRVAAAAFQSRRPMATAATLALAVVLIGSIACVRGALPSRSRDVYGPLAAGGDTSARRLNRSRPPRPRRRRIPRRRPIRHRRRRRFPRRRPLRRPRRPLPPRRTRRPRLRRPRRPLRRPRPPRRRLQHRPPRQLRPPKPTPTPRPSIVTPRRAATRDGVVPAALLATSDPSRARCHARTGTAATGRSRCRRAATTATCARRRRSCCSVTAMRWPGSRPWNASPRIGAGT